MLYQLSYTRILVDGEGFEPSKTIVNRFTACPLWPLGYPSPIFQSNLEIMLLELAMGLEPATC